MTLHDYKTHMEFHSLNNEINAKLLSITEKIRLIYAMHDYENFAHSFFLVNSFDSELDSFITKILTPADDNKE